MICGYVAYFSFTNEELIFASEARSKNERSLIYFIASLKVTPPKPAWKIFLLDENNLRKSSRLVWNCFFWAQGGRGNEIDENGNDAHSET